MKVYKPTVSAAHFEHILSEEGLVLLPIFLLDRSAEGGEINEAVSCDLVGEVQYLLLKRVQAQHLQRGVQVLATSDIRKRCLTRPSNTYLHSEAATFQN